jgi:hypothetical protein
MISAPGTFVAECFTPVAFDLNLQKIIDGSPVKLKKQS